MKFLQNQNEISTKLLRQQENTELQKKTIMMFDGSDVRKFPGFLAFCRTLTENSLGFRRTLNLEINYSP